MAEFLTESALWKELGLSRRDLGLPPLSAREIDRRLIVMNLIEHEKNVQQQKALAQAKQQGSPRFNAMPR